MSWHDYRDYRRIEHALAVADASFPARIWAAYCKADTTNRARLEYGFKEIIEEFRLRHDAPGGVLASDAPSIRARLAMEDPFGVR